MEKAGTDLGNHTSAGNEKASKMNKTRQFATCRQSVDQKEKAMSKAWIFCVKNDEF